MRERMERLTPTLIALGASWYPATAHAVVASCREHDLTLKLTEHAEPERLLKAIAILSPGTRWNNLLAAFPAWTRDFALRVPAYGRQVGSAIDALLFGAEPSGSKVSSFARALAGDESAVTIDLWMLRVLGRPDLAVKGVSSTTYRQQVADFLSEWDSRPSFLQDLTPRGMQAALWIQARQESA